MLSRIRNKYIRRFLIVLLLPFIFLFLAVYGAFIGSFVICEELIEWMGESGVVRHAWKGPQ